MKKKEAIDANRMVHVDLGRLSEGLALTFSGVTKVFESLGAEQIPGFGTVSTVEGEQGRTDDAAKKSKAAAKAEEKPKEGADEPPVDVSAEAAAEPASETAGPAGDTAVPEDKPNAETKTGSAAEPGSVFTHDDVMKIAAQKMAKDNSVTDKIWALVKTYGAEKLTDIPGDKLEAFMTDLTQI